MARSPGRGGSGAVRGRSGNPSPPPPPLPFLRFAPHTWKANEVSNPLRTRTGWMCHTEPRRPAVAGVTLRGRCAPSHPRPAAAQGVGSDTEGRPRTEGELGTAVRSASRTGCGARTLRLAGECPPPRRPARCRTAPPARSPGRAPARVGRESARVRRANLPPSLPRRPRAARRTKNELLEGSAASASPWRGWYA